MPRTALIDGWDEARRLGHHWVGDEHVLIALSRLASPAGELLRDAGATPDRLADELVRLLATCDPPVDSRPAESPSLTPAHHRTRGLAEGLALSYGSSATPELLLVAVVWRADGLASGLLQQLGIDRAALVASLAERGVQVPPGEPDPCDLRPTKRVGVPYEHLTTIVGSFPGLLAGDAYFGFNMHHKTKRAWIVVDEHVDAERLVTEILSG